ncbi:DUF1799 domain-containing protein [Pseudomonas cremoricolorata]|uniref:Phage protein n=1 Tax=Pseudomonas cremoricolorata TaxID=157783 RepID=A0A089YGC0_9PSED|nr:DUF1799 domain-containing protein [Pseudomonas cremoricolorata]AIR90758.1 phage protein [Pseudomonas cremoricolorata]
MAAFGLTSSDLVADEVEVWADGWPAFRLFEALGTQWRLAPRGPSGLDYTTLPVVASMLGIGRRDLAALFPDLRVMEAEALAVMTQSME